MRILYETGEKPLKGDTKVGEMVHNERDGITYTKNKYGDIIIIMQPPIITGNTDGVSWTKFPDGTLIQYGATVVKAVANTPSKGSQTIPIPFTNVLKYTVVPSPATSRPDVVITTTVLNRTTNTFDIYVLRTSDKDTLIRWSAIGRWKI